MNYRTSSETYESMVNRIVDVRDQSQELQGKADALKASADTLGEQSDAFLLRCVDSIQGDNDADQFYAAFGISPEDTSFLRKDS